MAGRSVWRRRHSTNTTRFTSRSTMPSASRTPFSSTPTTATSADVGDIEAIWLDECDEHSNPMGSRGIGEIGIVGTAASIVNGAYNATGIRIRDFPLTPPQLF